MKGILNGHRDKDLTKVGIEQAELIANKIKNKKIKFDKIYSSPLKRAFHTAEIIAKKNNLPKLIVKENLIERDFGEMTGEPHSRIVELCSPNIITTKNVHYFLEPTNGETFPQALKRSTNVLNEIKKENKDGNILLVVHGDIGKMIFASFYELPWKETLQKFYFGNADLLLLSKNCSADDAQVFNISDGETKAQLV